MRHLWPILSILSAGCSKAPAEETDDGLPCAVTLDCWDTTDDPTDGGAAPTGDSGGATTGGTDGGATGDTGGSTTDGGATGDTGGSETAGPETCSGRVTFTDKYGNETDYTEAFTEGTEVEIADDGTLLFCEGEWYVLLTVRESEVDIMGGGDDPGDTVLSSGESGTVLSFRGPDLEVSLSNLTVERGAALGTGNRSSGGGLRCTEDAEVTMTDMIFTRNQAYDGAAVFGDDNCTMYISDSEFVANETIDDGAAVRMDAGSHAEIDGVLFKDNVARDGGALMAYSGSLEVTSCTFKGNRASTYGGAVWNYYGELYVADSTFEGSQASYSGGAMMLLGDTTLVNVVFDGSSAAQGGAIYSYGSSGTLRGEGVDFINSNPHDIYLYASGAGGALTYDLGKGADFTCDNTGCY